MSLSSWITMVPYWDLSDWLKNISEVIFVTWSFVPIILLTPVAACLLRSSRRPTLNLCATLLLFFSGAVVSCSFFFVLAFIDDIITRVSFWQAMTKDAGAQWLFISFWEITAFNLLIWTACELYRKWRKRPHPVTFPNRLLLWGVPILILLSAPPAYFLPKYQTLQDAVESGDVELVKKRLAFNLLGVTANTGYIYKSSSIPTETNSLVPLAVQNGNVEIVRLLLEDGGSLGKYAVNRPSGNAFSYARENPQMMQCLLEHAKPNVGLWGAVEERDIDLIQLFLFRGADPFATKAIFSGGEGVTVFELLDFYFYDADSAGETASFLKEHIRSLNDPRKYTLLEDIDGLRQALGAGLKPDALYPSSNPQKSLLHWTIERLSNTAQDTAWNFPQHRGKTLIVRRLTRYCDTVDLLLAHGADPNVRDPHGKTPLHMLVGAPRMHLPEPYSTPYRSSYDDLVDNERLAQCAVEDSLLRVARALVEHGGDPWLRSGKSHTSPMDILENTIPYRRNEQLFEYFQSVRREQRTGAVPRTPRPGVQK